jgi:hypothetical protein
VRDANYVDDEIPAEINCIYDEIPAEESCVDDEVPAEESCVDDEVPAEESCGDDEVPAEESCVDDMIAEGVSTPLASEHYSLLTESLDLTDIASWTGGQLVRYNRVLQY